MALTRDRVRERGGFEVLERPGTAVPPGLIFVTAFDRQALRMLGIRFGESSLVYLR